jgi:hypothetical protein
MAATLTRDAILLELGRLEIEERIVSEERRRLHRRIDRSPARSAHLHEHERELSARRKQLHRRIDELRPMVGRKPGPTPVATPHQLRLFWPHEDDHT